MESTAKRRLALLGGGVLLAATVATLAQILLLGESVVDAEPYAVAIGLGVSMPMLLSAAYPLTSGASRQRRAALAVAESVAGIVLGVGAVALLIAVEGPAMLSVGGGAAAAYVGGVSARALVLGRVATDEIGGEA